MSKKEIINSDFEVLKEFYNKPKQKVVNDKLKILTYKAKAKSGLENVVAIYHFKYNEGKDPLYFYENTLTEIAQMSFDSFYVNSRSK